MTDGSKITKEDVEGNIKVLTITADDNSYPMYIRAKAFCIGSVNLTLQNDSTGWTEDADAHAADPYTYVYYYGELIDGLPDTDFKQDANDLKLKVELPNPFKEGDELHIALVYEAVPAIYDEVNNTWLEPDWSGTVVTGGNS